MHSDIATFRAPTAEHDVVVLIGKPTPCYHPLSWQVADKFCKPDNSTPTMKGGFSVFPQSAMAMCKIIAESYETGVQVRFTNPTGYCGGVYKTEDMEKLFCGVQYYGLSCLGQSLETILRECHRQKPLLVILLICSVPSGEPSSELFNTISRAPEDVHLVFMQLGARITTATFLRLLERAFPKIQCQRGRVTLYNVVAVTKKL